MRYVLLVLVLAGAGVAGPMDQAVNARLRAVMARYALGDAAVQVSAPVRTPAPIQVPPTKAGRPAVRWRKLCATTDDLGGGSTVGHPGPRGNWKARGSDPYIALPDRALRGRTFWLQCLCPRHGAASPLVPAPVHDIGPWSVSDGFVRERRRPWAEQGRSDKYRHVPARAPAVDLSPAMWARLGHPGANGNFSGYVDLVELDEHVVPVPADRARRSD